MYRYMAMLWFRRNGPRAVEAMRGTLLPLVARMEGLQDMELARNQGGVKDACDACLILVFRDARALRACRASAVWDAFRAALETTCVRVCEGEYPAPRRREMPRLYACIGPSNRERAMLGRLLDAGMCGIRVSLLHHSVQEAQPIADAFWAEARKRGARGELLLEAARGAAVTQPLSALGATGLIASVRGNARLLEDVRGLCGPSVRLYAKVECGEDIEALPQMLACAQAVIIARAGLRRNLPLHSIPDAQRRVSATCRRHGAPFMVATDLLGSMQGSLYPTAAELCDVHHAVQDGAAALMLNREVAVGNYPVEAMETLRQAAEAAIR